MSEDSEIYARPQASMIPALRLLAECINDFLAMEGVDADACRDLAEKLDSHAFDILVVGQFNHGKTTLINALIGEALLPMGVIPLASVVTVLSFVKRRI